MKTVPDAALRIMAVLAALVLGGCAASHGGPSPGGHHAGPSTAAAAPPPSGPFYGLETTTGGSAAGSATRHSDEGAMCAMHQDMKNAPNEEARRAMVERHMQGMSPEQRQQHMEMMRRHCK